MTPARSAGSLLVLVLLLCLPGHGSAYADGRGQVVNEELEKKKAAMLLRVQVNRAIGSGARWIASMQRNDGSFALPKNVGEGPFPQSRHRFGTTALCFYTLADCGYDADREEIRKALGYLRKHYRSYLKGDHWPQASSYSLSLFVLGLHNLFVRPGARKKLDQRDRYGNKKIDKKNPCGYPKWAARLIKSVLDWLMSNQAETGLFRYPGGFNTGTGPPPPGIPASHMGPEDLSNTQYVLLALWAGSRCGYDIPVKVLEKIASRLLDYQERGGPKVDRERDPEPPKPARAGKKKGRYAEPARPPPQAPKEKDQARGFPYTLGRESTGSMTTAGLSSLVIVKAMLMERNGLKAKLARRLDRGIWDGIAWLAYNYTLTSNPGAPGKTWQYYYLYGLERACVIAGKKFLGKRDWYAEGARLLVDAQLEDGRWKPSGQLGNFGMGPSGASQFQTDILDSCFALLFLKRATIVPKRPVLDGPVTTPSGGKQK